VRVDLDGRPVVREVSLVALGGGWLALIGPNGSGKSSFIRACAGLLNYEGEFIFDGIDLRTLRGRDRARLVGYVPQEPVLPPDMTVAEYVLLGRTAHIGYFGNAGTRDRSEAADAMARLDVAAFAGRRLARLSGGERQRVVLARALAGRPRLLLLDEPTSMLDIGHEQSVLDLVDGLRADGLTVLSALHDLTLAGQYATRLVLLDSGSVAAAGPAPEVLTETMIERVYAARVTVTRDADGGSVVAPRRRSRESCLGTGAGVPGDDPGGADGHDDPLVAGLVHVAQVRAVLGAHLIGELVVVVRLDLRVAAQLDVPRRRGAGDDQAALGVGGQVLRLLAGRAQRDLHCGALGAVLGQEPQRGQLRPAARPDGGEDGHLGVEQVAVRVRNGSHGA
jgi:iron complex transport system ATP-binding protein